MIIKNEVSNIKELLESIKIENEFKTKVCVVCFLFDKDGKLILHRRGAMARDEVNMLEAIGGAIDKNDLSFRDAVKRELKEEAGNDAVITIGDFIGGQMETKYDKNANETINWIILAYKGLLESGELINMEPDRCVGFEANYPENFDKNDLSVTCSKFVDELIKHK